MDASILASFAIPTGNNIHQYKCNNRFIICTRKKATVLKYSLSNILDKIYRSNFEQHNTVTSVSRNQ